MNKFLEVSQAGLPEAVQEDPSLTAGLLAAAYLEAEKPLLVDTECDVVDKWREATVDKCTASIAVEIFLSLVFRAKADHSIQSKPVI